MTNTPETRLYEKIHIYCKNFVPLWNLHQYFKFRLFSLCIIKKDHLFYLKVIYENSTTTINEFSKIYFNKGKLRG